MYAGVLVSFRYLSPLWCVDREGFHLWEMTIFLIPIHSLFLFQQNGKKRQQKKKRELKFIAPSGTTRGRRTLLSTSLSIDHLKPDTPAATSINTERGCTSRLLRLTVFWQLISNTIWSYLSFSLAVTFIRLETLRRSHPNSVSSSST